MAPEFMNGRF